MVPCLACPFFFRLACTLVASYLPNPYCGSPLSLQPTVTPPPPQQLHKSRSRAIRVVSEEEFLDFPLDLIALHSHCSYNGVQQTLQPRRAPKACCTAPPNPSHTQSVLPRSANPLSGSRNPSRYVVYRPRPPVRLALFRTPYYPIGLLRAITDLPFADKLTLHCRRAALPRNLHNRLLPNLVTRASPLRQSRATIITVPIPGTTTAGRAPTPCTASALLLRRAARVLLPNTDPHPTRDRPRLLPLMPLPMALTRLSCPSFEPSIRMVRSAAICSCPRPARLMGLHRYRPAFRARTVHRPRQRRLDRFRPANGAHDDPHV